MDRHEIEQLRQKSELERQNKAIQDAHDLKTVCDTAEGRRLMLRIFSECGIYHSSFSGDALTTAFQEGKRSLGLWMIEQFSNIPGLYIKLLQEELDAYIDNDA